MDKIADLLNRILNAQKAGHRLVEAPFCRPSLNVANILKESGLVKDVQEKTSKNNLRVLLISLRDDQPIAGFKRISRLGRRIYQKSKELKKVRSGYGLAIVSTSQGVLTAKEAKKRKLGGEVWCEIW